MSTLTKPAEFDSIRALLVRYAARLQDKNEEPPGQFLIAHAFLRAVELIDLLALRAEDADQFRSTLELIAGSAADKLQGLQAQSALERVRPASKCCALGCDQEGTVTIDMIDRETLRPAPPKFFCPTHATPR